MIGESFSSYVRDQIDTRQKKLSSLNRNDDLLTWSNSNTAFLRLSSCVDLNSGGEGYGNSREISVMNRVQKEFVEKKQKETAELVRKIAEELGDPNLTGDELARRAVLFNGLSSVSKSENGDLSPNPQKFGISSDPNSIWNNAAYGFGGASPFGYKPMPGLIGADITYYNMGTLKKVTIQAKAFNVKQLEILDLLYMRLGYNILLEWGHTIYMDNEGNKQTLKDYVTEPFRRVFSKSKKNNQFNILKSIEKQRKISNGNYDAFFGPVTKFNWSFNDDGSYDITIEAISQGSVIESMNVGQNLPYEILEGEQPELKLVKTDSDNEEKEDQPQDNKEEKTIKSTDTANVSMNEIEGVIPKLFPIKVENQTTVEENKKELKTLNANSFSPSRSYLEGKLKEIVRLLNKEDGSKNLDGFIARSEGYKRGNMNIKISTLKFPFEYIEKNSNNIYEEYSQNYYYINLGGLLELIRENNLLYNEVNPEEVVPLIDIDNDIKNNFCIKHPDTVSTDPSKCIVPHNFNFKDEKDEKGYWKYYNKFNDDWSITNNLYIGKLMGIHINIYHVINIINNKSLFKTYGPLSKGVNLYDFLKIIMDDVSSSLGDINNFNITYDSETNFLKIYDNNNLNYSNIKKDEVLAQFEPYGITNKLGGSFLKSVNFNVTISNEFATMVSVGAQANANVIGESSTGLSSLNQGLIDRITPKKQDIGTVSGKGFTEKIKVSRKQIRELFKEIYDGRKIIKKNIESLKQAFESYSNYYINRASQEEIIPAPFFLPFDLNISMVGLSGMKIYQRFTINDNILPSTYKTKMKDGTYSSKIEFLIKGVTHTIKDNVWTSTLDSLTVPSYVPNIPTKIIDPLLLEEETKKEEKTADIPNSKKFINPDNPTSLSSILLAIGEKPGTFTYEWALKQTTTEGWVKNHVETDLTPSGFIGSASYRNNNPGNLQYYNDLKSIDPKVKIENWKGLTDLGPKAENRKFFAQFSTPYLGMKALIDKIKRWAKGGMPPTSSNIKLGWKENNPPTLKEYLYTYAPPHENNSNLYLNGLIEEIKLKLKDNTINANTLVIDLIKKYG